MFWNFADAEKNLEELITRAIADGPQTIRGIEEPVVVMSEIEYQALIAKKKKTLQEFLLSAPKVGELEQRPRRGTLRDPKL